jgi:hypothetical protein
LAPKKKKLTRQQILIYVISGLMILSLAIGFVVGSGRRSRSVPTAVPQSTILLETPAPTGQATPATVEPTSVEPTSAN